MKNSLSHRRWSLFSIKVRAHKNVEGTILEVIPSPGEKRVKINKSEHFPHLIKSSITQTQGKEINSSKERFTTVESLHKYQVNRTTLKLFFQNPKRCITFH